MKFPKERVVINTRVKEYLNNNKYYEVIKMKDEIFSSLDVLDDYAVDALIKSAFIVGDFDMVGLIFSECFKHRKESFALLYYGMLGFLANVDIYQAVSYIKKSELLNQASIKEYFEKDGANYSNILYLSRIDTYGPLALILVNFIDGIAREIVGNDDIDREYILFRFFDLINMLYEIGYPDEIITKLTGALKVMFNLEI